MKLEADADAVDFAGTVRDLLAKAAAPEALHAAWDSADGLVPGLWDSLASLGALGLVVPEQYGGAGLDLTAAVPLLVEAGRACLPAPMLESVVASVVLAAAGGAAADRWLADLGAGAVVAGLATSTDGVVSAWPSAELLLLVDGLELHAVPTASVELSAAASIDQGVRLATATWQPTAASRLDVAADVVADVAAVAAAAVLVGLAEAMLDMAVGYAKTREQFGQVIGGFQAVKHQLADSFVATSFAVPVVSRAAWSIAHDLPSRPRDASHAKVAASVAAARAARTALQVHAGIGYTFEHHLHMWLKRTWTLRSLYGDDTWHRARLAGLVLGADRAPRVP